MTYVKTNSNYKLCNCDIKNENTYKKLQNLLYVIKMKAAYLFERLEPT
jgi:hypothetical protein